MPIKGKWRQPICQDNSRMEFSRKEPATFVSRGVSRGGREPKYRASGILCAVLRRFPSPWQAFGYGDTGRQPPGWHSAGRWERCKRRRRKLIQWMRGKARHIHGPREKYRCPRLRRSKRREHALAGHLRRSAEARGG